MDEMLQTAELVFEGKVVASEARWNAANTLIKTYVTFDISEVVVGDYSQSTIQLSFIGGSVGEDKIEAEGMQYPKLGEEGIYFVEKLGRELINPLVGWSQGHFLVKSDNSGNQIIMTNAEKPVMALSNKTAPSNTSQKFSEGVAKGVVTQSKPQDKPMTATSFKRAIKSRMQQISQ